MSDKVTKIVITTRFYPASQGWSECPFDKGKDYNDFLDSKINNDIRKSFAESPSIKACPLGRFKVYVSPCLLDSTEPGKKANYLENVVKVVRNDSNSDCDFDEGFFLIAHDKDFVFTGEASEADGIIAGKSHFFEQLSECTNLSRLVENHRVIMFKHAGKKFGQWITSEKLNLNEDNDSRLTEKDCEDMYHVIVKEVEMAEFFGSVSQDSSFVYPKLAE